MRGEELRNLVVEEGESRGAETKCVGGEVEAATDDPSLELSGPIAAITKPGEDPLEIERHRLARGPGGVPPDRARVAGAGRPRVCNTLNVAFEGCDGETLLAALDLEGIAVSTGSACSSGSLEPSPVLLAMGYPPSLARGAIRFSLWSGNTGEEIDRVCAVLPRVVARARS